MSEVKKSAVKKSEPSVSVIEPSVKVEGHVNPYIKFFEKEHPELVSIGFSRLPETNTYVSYTVYSKGGVITKIVVEEPNLKLVAEESAKIAFVNNFVDEE